MNRDWKRIPLNDYSNFVELQQKDIGVSVRRSAKVLLSSEFKNGSLGKLLDVQIKDDQIYALFTKSFVQVNLTNQRARYSNLEEKVFDKIHILTNQILLSGKTRALIMRPARYEFKFDTKIANVLDYRGAIIFVLTDGSCYCYSKHNGEWKELWQTISPTQSDYGVRASTMNLNKVAMVHSGQVVLINADNGVIDSYIKIKDSESENVSLATVGTELLATADDVLLMMNVLSNKYTKYKIKNLFAVVGLKDLILLRTHDGIFVTKFDLLYDQKKYITRIDLNGYKSALFHDHLLYMLTKFEKVKAYNLSGELAFETKGSHCVPYERGTLIVDKNQIKQIRHE